MKRILSVFFALAMCVSMVMPALASGGDAQPCAAQCPKCGGGEMVHRSTTYEDWLTVDRPNCHLGDISHKDLEQERYITVIYECSHCLISNRTVTCETRTICPPARRVAR